MKQFPAAGGTASRDNTIMLDSTNVSCYWDHVHQCDAVKVFPGGYHVSNKDELIVTTLGSCVSACIIDSTAGVYGMNHFMLPVNSDMQNDKRGVGVSAMARYGDYAMEVLLNEMYKKGAKKERLEVKLFGGGKVLRQMTNIGQMNINFVLYYVEVEKLNLVADDLGDIHPRKIYFFTDTGRVRVKKLRIMHNNTLAEREMKYLHILESQPISGDVEIFE